MIAGPQKACPEYCRPGWEEGKRVGSGSFMMEILERT